VAACKSELPKTLEQTHHPQLAVENQLSEAQIRSQYGIHMVYVPAGKFAMGTSEAELDLFMAACVEAYGLVNEAR